MEYVLYHHGVKGMRWGVRKKGLVPAGKSKIRKRTDKNAKADDPSTDAKSVAKGKKVAKGRSAARTALGVLGGLALGTAVAYGATVYAANSVTRVLNDWQSELDRL